ncbi:MAG: hypothetical protein DHS20C17_07310 [Cyclobacteriaceae bacterium]|nr:MAG: hypothetical protein DHS20C17_07310 [Cyclobacteriaceae bacterium]
MANNNVKQRNWTGVVLVVVGLAFLLKNLHLLPLPHVFFSWKAILVLIGLIGISLGKKEGFVPLIIGALFIFIYDILGLHYFGFGDLWPLALVLVGIALLMRHRQNNLPSSPEGELDQVVLFGSVEKQINSQDFKGGKATSLFGGLDLDMRLAGLSNNTAVLDLLTIFGGVEIKVPADWAVNVSELTVLFGGFEDKRSGIPLSESEPSKTLYVKGLILFGGGEIKNG